MARQYIELVKDIMENGTFKGDRTGTGTQSVFGRQIRFDLSKGFPLLTTKRTAWKPIVHELLWFLSGDTNIKYLQENGVKIWNEWADEEGDLGPVYGHQWRSFGYYGKAQRNINIEGETRYEALDLVPVDQITNIINRIRTNPNCRRLIVSAWNPMEIDEMALPPCHTMFQFYVADGKLSCQLYQRSADVFLGVPFNIASYALLTHLVAHVTGLQVGEFIHTFGDVHIYNNHRVQLEEQIKRPWLYPPTLKINKETDNIFDIKFDDIELIGYNYHPAIRGEVSV